ncbi:MAG: DEAD/DEAH box helicase [Bdellovibrionota bacterium]
MTTFKEMNLSAPLMRAIESMGYTEPSPIQAQALPLLLGQNTDFVGLAATGTGKTAAFSIPLLERIEGSVRGVQALILCPTRELALQVAGQIDLLGKYMNVQALPIYGGSSYSDQIHGLKRGMQIVVGTPGRVIDHMERGTLKLDNLHTLILDEADEMISMGFKEELDKILSAVPKESSNIWLFSATLGREVRRVADAYLTNPKQIQINTKEVLSNTVEQYYYITRESNKPEVICKLIDAADDFYGIIFCQTKILVTELSRYLSEQGYKVDSLHGDKSQNERERTMQAFRDRKVKMLICTDVAARGLDVKDVSHVINYSLPRELDSYVHRIGRTARSGKAGLALNLVTPSHQRLIAQIERVTKSKMKEGVLPTRKDLGAKKVAAVVEKFKGQKFFQRAVDVMGDDWKEALKDMSAEEIAGRFLCLNFPEVFLDKEPTKGHSFGQHEERAPRRRDDGGGRRRFGGGGGDRRSGGSSRRSSGGGGGGGFRRGRAEGSSFRDRK